MELEIVVDLIYFFYLCVIPTTFWFGVRWVTIPHGQDYGKPGTSLALSIHITIVASACWIFALGGLHTHINVIVLLAGACCGFCIKLLFERCFRPHASLVIGFVPKALLNSCACIIAICLFFSARAGYSYKSLIDPARRVQGVGVEHLAEAYRGNPDAYDVVLSNGYVHIPWTGYYSEEHFAVAEFGTHHYAAAPIYRDAASASGQPLGWALASSTEWFGPLKPVPPADLVQPSYCAGAGLCGFRGDCNIDSAKCLPFGSEDDASDEDYHFEHRLAYEGAMQRAAKAGGFKYEKGLPTVLMVNPMDRLIQAEKLYSYFGYLLTAYIVVMTLGDIDAMLGCCRKEAMIKND